MQSNLNNLLSDSNMPKDKSSGVNNNRFMEAFPTKFNREYLTMKLKKNQDNIIRDTRKQFSEEIYRSINNYSKQITLKFDKKVWKSSRFQIVEELLNIHGNLQLTTLSNQSHNVNITYNLPKEEFIDTIIIRI